MPSAVDALASKVESVEFLNDLLAQLWPYLNVAASKTVKETVEPMFAELLPSPFKGMKFSRVDLGAVPIAFGRVDVIARTKDSIQLDLDLDWDGKSDIALDVPIVGLVGVEHVKLRGRLSLIMQPLVTVMPVVGAVQVAFINAPFVDVDFKGAANIADSSLLKGSIRKVINQVVASLMVLPNRMLIPLNPGNDYFSTYILPKGYARITLVSGTGFKSTGRLIKDVPDLYCFVSLGTETPIQSKVMKNSEEPEWNQSFDMLWSDDDQIIKVAAWDKDKVNKDDNMGIAEVSLAEVIAAGKTKQVPLKLDGKPTDTYVTVSVQMLEFSSSKSNFDLAMRGKHKKCGMLSVIVAGAKDIPYEKDMAPRCKVTVGEEEFLTPAVVEAPGTNPRVPAFNSTFRIPLDAALLGKAPSVTFELMNKKVKLGEGVVEFGDVMDAADMRLRNNFEMEKGGTLMTSVVLSSLGTDA